MFTLKLGLRNLTRHKKRTLATAVVISFAVLIYLVSESLMVGFENISYNNIVDLESGHLQVAHPDYWEDREKAPLENLIPLTEELLQEIKGTEGVEGVSPQLKFSANLNNGIDELPVYGIGINPDTHNQLFTTSDYLVEGRMLKNGQYEAVLGKSLAELMELKVGDYLTLLVRTREKTFNTLDAEIVGLVSTPNPSVNDNFVYVPLDVARDTLNLDKEVSTIIVKIEGGREAAREVTGELSRQLKNQGYNYQAFPWQEIARSFIALMQAEEVESITILGIILLIASVGIINTTLLSALERMEEIGMMKAMGLKEGEIVRTFMAEAAGIGIIGGVIGCLLGGLTTLYLAEVGLSMNSLGMGDIDIGIPIVDMVYGGWNPGSFLFIFIFSVLVAVLASILPARWAARKDPVKAIYHR